MNAPVFATLGCRLNAYETEAMKELSAAAGVENAVIVNTCAVTAEAVRKAKQEIRRLSRENPGATIIVTGCAAPFLFAPLFKVTAVGNSGQTINCNHPVQFLIGTQQFLSQDFQLILIIQHSAANRQTALQLF